MSRLTGYLPVGAACSKDVPVVTWRSIAATPFDEPFFADTVNRHRDLARGDDIVADISTMREDVTSLETIEPTGFIFHMSRCGSTLLCQMLAALRKNRVISEPTVLNDVLFPRATPFSRGCLVDWLKLLIGALGQRATREEQRYFLKFRSWSVFSLPVLREAFPTVPWMFLYRDPVEVMVSALRKPPAYLRTKGAEGAGFLPWLGIDIATAESLSPEEYIARMLREYCRTVLHEMDSLGLVVNYRDLPEALTEKVLPHFGVDFDEAEATIMRLASAYYSKDFVGRKAFFTSDNEEKQKAATPTLRRAAEEWALPAIVELESMNGARQ